MKDREENWTEITLADSLSILAMQVAAKSLDAPAYIAIDRLGLCLYVPTVEGIRKQIALDASSEEFLPEVCVV